MTPLDLSLTAAVKFSLRPPGTLKRTMPLAFLASGGDSTLTTMYGFHGNLKCNDIFKE
jgi:hypothetical protein